MIRSSRTTVALGVVAMAAGAFLLIGSALATGRPDRPAADPSVLAVAVQHADVPRIVLLNVSQETTAEVAHPSGANSPAWSPDGKRIACVSLAPGQIFAMNADGTGSVQLTNTAGSEVCPSWSPDGKKIAFTSDRTGNYEVFVMNPDGSDPTNLTNNPAWDADPGWSPDGKSIAFASNRTGTFRLWTMNGDGSNQRELLAKDLHGWVFPAWSPDGQQLLFSGMLENGSIQLFVANADGKGAEQITNGDGTNSWAAWSPDGRYIAYIHYDKPPDPARGYALDPAGGRLMLIDLTSDTRRQVAPGDMRCFGCRPAWRPTRR